MKLLASAPLASAPLASAPLASAPLASAPVLVLLAFLEVFASALFALAPFASAPDPISDRLRYEIASAQRDVLLAKQQYDEAALRLRSKLEQAEKSCGAEASGDRRFDLASFTCLDKPK